jgi:CRISPR-associated DxTHG motif protein
MKKAVITILGMIKPPKDEQNKAKYYFSNELKNKFSLKKENYTNMLPLIVDNFKEYRDVKSIYTNMSKKAQEEVLKYENIDYDIEKNGLFISEYVQDNESRYSYFLEKYNELIEQYDRVIIDVSHGFRHLPILATVNLIMQNIKEPNKIEYILFAKEIEQGKEYEIIDLKEYLSLANLSYLLSTFNQNYTVSSNINFKNPLYKQIAKELSEFSHHFLSNSLKSLIEGELIVNIIKNLQELQKDKSLENFKHYIKDIIKHLQDIKNLNNESEWKKLYEISKMMHKRGYQLNAITLLFEAIGFYCLESLSQIKLLGNRTKEYYTFIKSKKTPLHIYSTYTMTNQIRTLVKVLEGFKINDERLFISNDNLKNRIIEYLDDVQDLHKFQELIKNLEALRNNLAHGNSSYEVNDVKKAYEEFLKIFEKFAIKKDIFKTAKEFNKIDDIERLKNKFQR